MRSTEPSPPKQSAFRTPSGLLLPLRAKLRGRVRWSMLDERGVPVVPRGPSGAAVASVAGVEQPNLITDLGLNRLAALSCFSTSTTIATAWRRRLAVGTGSTAPAVGDTTLDNEVQRAATSGGFSSGSNTYSLDTGTNEWVAESLVTRLVTMTESRNITEFGLAQETTADIVIRELLRDSGGTPITVTIPEGKTLRVDHTLEVRLPAPESGVAATLDIEEYDISDALVDTIGYDITHGGYTSDAVVEGIFRVWNPAISTGPAAYAVSSSWSYSRTTNPTVMSGTQVLLSLVDYTPDSLQRVKRATFSTAQANADLRGFRFVSGTVGVPFNRGWVIRFDDPETYTKVNTDTLRVGLVSSWARA